MLFNSLEFIIFFFFTTIIYFLIPGKYQKYFLLLISLFFYGYFNFNYLLILIGVVVLNYYFAFKVDKSDDKRRKIYFVIVLILNILILFFFKYLNFFNSNIGELAKLIGWNYSVHILNIVLPLGISFYIFKCISYEIEVYRKTIPLEKRIDIFALYIIIFPELLAGPIDKPQNLIPQLDKGYGFDYDRVTNGLKLMTWGFFQKWVIADRLAPIVDTIYNDPHSYTGIYFVFATFLFAIQIYCDFSAYSDIAIGAGEVLGFKFMKNFNRPYFAKSVSEFWRRWHISLTTWLRDYLFLPIAYSTLRKLKNKPLLKIKPEVWSYCTASLLTMFIAGLWHGASWNFVIWGSLIGVYLVFSFFTKKLRKKTIRFFRLKQFPKIHKLFSAGITFSLICFAWIFFRSNTIQDALYIIRHIYTGFTGYFKIVLVNIKAFHLKGIIDPFMLGFKPLELYLSIISILFLLAIHLFQRKRNIREFISEQHILIRWAGYLLIIFIILLFGKFESRQFIYLQF